MIDNNRHIEQMLEGLWESCNLAELNGRLKEIYEFFDAEKFSVVTYFDIEKSKKGFDFFETYPSEWVNHYIENQYHLHDPILSWGKICLPFHWKGSEKKDLTPIQKCLFSEAHDFGINEGVTLSLHPSPREQTFITVLNIDKLRPVMLHAVSLASQFYLHIKQKIDAIYLISSLTTREREVIYLKAQGTSSRRVAEILSISEPTVVFHLKNARRKLNVSTSEEVLFIVGLALGKSSQPNNYKDSLHYHNNYYEMAMISLRGL